MSVLIVEDDQVIIMFLSALLRDAGFKEIVTAHDLDTAVEHSSNTHFRLCLLDMTLAHASAMPVVSNLRRQGTPFIITTGHLQEDLPVEVRGETILFKPYGPGDVYAAMKDLGLSVMDDARQR